MGLARLIFVFLVVAYATVVVATWTQTVGVGSATTSEEKVSASKSIDSEIAARQVEIQRLTRAESVARGRSDWWDKVTIALLWTTAFVALLTAFSAVGLFRAKNRVLSEQGSLAAAKETKFNLLIQLDKDKLEQERDARIELEERYAPRRLLRIERSELASQLTTFAKQTVSLWFHAGDREGADFASDIARALEAAHWDVFAPASVIDLAESGRHGVTLVKTGVTVTSTADVGSVRASEALVRDLKSLGYDADRSGTPDKRTSPLVTVTVESRPEGAQGEAKLRRMKH